MALRKRGSLPVGRRRRCILGMLRRLWGDADAVRQRSPRRPDASRRGLARIEDGQAAARHARLWTLDPAGASVQPRGSNYRPSAGAAAWRCDVPCWGRRDGHAGSRLRIRRPTWCMTATARLRSCRSSESRCEDDSGTTGLDSDRLPAAPARHPSTTANVRRGRLCRRPGPKSAGDDDRVQHLVVLEHHHEVRVEPLGDRRIADRAALVGRVRRTSASTAVIVEPRCGVSTPAGLMATWPSTARVSRRRAPRAPSANATTVIFNVRASMAFSCGRRLDRGGNIRPAVAKSAAVAMLPTHI